MNGGLSGMSCRRVPSVRVDGWLWKSGPERVGWPERDTQRYHESGIKLTSLSPRSDALFARIPALFFIHKQRDGNFRVLARYLVRHDEKRLSLVCHPAWPVNESSFFTGTTHFLITMNPIRPQTFDCVFLNVYRAFRKTVKAFADLKFFVIGIHRKVALITQMLKPSISREKLIKQAGCTLEWMF